jgi:hypothetical protein
MKVEGCWDCPFQQNIDGDYRQWCGLEDLASFDGIKTIDELETNPPPDCPLKSGPITVELGEPDRCVLCGTTDMVKKAKIKSQTSCIPCYELIVKYYEVVDED